jgi:hypothetical protein
LGGGICSVSGSLCLTNCTIALNQSIGGNGASGGTIYYDPAGTGGGGGGLGGGIFIFGGSNFLVCCTISSNTCQGGSGSNNGKGVGGGIFSTNGTCNILNTIVAGNSASTAEPDVYGAVNSAGYNFIGNTTGSSGWDPVWDYQNATPLNLGPLQNNGGPTLTCALLPGSLCILGGTSLGAPTVDQRGVIRPANSVDIGAYQYTTLLQTVVSWNTPANIVYGTALGTNQLNATANYGGTFTYTPALGSILNAGSNQVLQAVFTPSDPTSYTGATNTVLLTVLKATQTISFPTIPPQTVNAAPILLNATSSSGLPVTYTLLSGDALLAGNLLSVGTTPSIVSVLASQSGDPNYLAATSITNSFQVMATAPLISSQPTNITTFVGGNAAFSVTATTSLLTYQWQYAGLNLAGQTNQALTLNYVTTNQAGSYRVIVSNPIGSVTSSVVTLTITASPGYPVIVSGPGGGFVLSGKTASLALGCTGNSPLVYRWYKGLRGDTSTLAYSATNNGNYTTAVLTNNTSYWCLASNSLGMAASTTAGISVLPAQTPVLTFAFFAGYPSVSINGLSGTNYAVQYSTNMTIWNTLLNFQMSTPPYLYIDTAGAGQKQRFYRAYAY